MLLCRYGDTGASAAAPTHGAALSSSMVQLRLTCLQDDGPSATLTKRFPSAPDPFLCGPTCTVQATSLHLVLAAACISSGPCHSLQSQHEGQACCLTIPLMPFMMADLV